MCSRIFSSRSCSFGWVNGLANVPSDRSGKDGAVSSAAAGLSRTGGVWVTKARMSFGAAAAPAEDIEPEKSFASIQGFGGKMDLPALTKNFIGDIKTTEFTLVDGIPHKKGKKVKLSERVERMLEHSDPEIRRQALCSLRKQRDENSIVPVLIKCLEDENWRVRRTAVEMLLNIRSEMVIKELTRNLYNENINARNSSIEALMEIGVEAVSHLINEFKGADNDVKKFIVDILGNSGDLKAFPLLLYSLNLN